MIEYQKLKLESKLNNNTQQTINNLFNLLKQHNKNITLKIIKNSIIKSTNPINLIKIIKP